MTTEKFRELDELARKREKAHAGVVEARRRREAYEAKAEQFEAELAALLNRWMEENDTQGENE